MLNFGARRLRACRIAGLTSIAATVNEMADSYDQVIENEQREGLKPLELALFVRNRMALGESQADIARQLGKSASFVTYATALIDAPDWLMALYRSGRCRGTRELYELRQLGPARPECVQELQAQVGPITREMVAAIKNRADDAVQAAGADMQCRMRAAAPSKGMGSAAASGSLAHQPTVRAKVAARPGVDAINPRFTLIACLDGGTDEVVVDAAPAEEGSIFVRDAADQPRRAVQAAALTLLRIVGDRDHSTV